MFHVGAVAALFAFTWSGTLSLEGGPIFRVAIHRIHHQISDQSGDHPHSPRGWQPGGLTPAGFCSVRIALESNQYSARHDVISLPRSVEATAF
jgi:fatty-acid desaturase